MAIDSSIALSGKQYLAPDILGNVYKAITLGSLLDQRKLQAEEAERKKWMERYQLSEAERAASALRTAGLKATKPDGSVDRDVLMSELFKAGHFKEGRAQLGAFGTYDKQQADIKKQDFERRGEMAKIAHSGLSGIRDLGVRFGFDSPEVRQANRAFKMQYNQMVAQYGGDPVPMDDDAVDPRNLDAAIERFKSDAQRHAEFTAMPENVRTAMAHERRFGGQGDQGSIETTVTPTEDTDVDSILSGQNVPEDESVQIQTFTPDEIRSEEQGGVIEGQAPRLIQTGMPATQTTLREVTAPRPRTSFVERSMRNAALGDATKPVVWDEQGNPVINQVALDAQLKARKAGAANTKVDVNVPINAYEKSVAQKRGEQQVKVEQQAEAANSAVSRIADIVNVLQQHGSGRWDQVGAVLGEYMPGTSFAKITSARDVANAIRAELAPQLRVEGSGATSDFEMRMWLDAIPNLVTYPEGRQKMLDMAAKFAQRAEAVAAIRNQLIEADQYTPQRLREAVEKQLGKNTLDKADRQVIEGRKGAPVVEDLRKKYGLE